MYHWNIVENLWANHLFGSWNSQPIPQPHTSVINIYHNHYIESNPSGLRFDPRYPHKVIRFPDSNTWTAGITGQVVILVQSFLIVLNTNVGEHPIRAVLTEL